VRKAVDTFNDLQDVMDMALDILGMSEELFAAFHEAGRDALSSGLVKKKGGDSFSTRYGIEEHNEFKGRARGAGLRTEWTPGGTKGMRIDAADLVKRIIYELKPGSRSGLRSGRAAIRRYLKELNKDLKPGEKAWEGMLVFY
jgi:hypothetical protein